MEPSRELFWELEASPPNELVEFIADSDGICPSCRSSGAVISEAMTSGLAPGSCVVTCTVGKSTCGSAETGSAK